MYYEINIRLSNTYQFKIILSSTNFAMFLLLITSTKLLRTTAKSYILKTYVNFETLGKPKTRDKYL